MEWLLSWLDRVPNGLAQELYRRLPELYVLWEMAGTEGRLEMTKLMAVVLEKKV